jgi:KDO2-lipid IV(A) lauroyltransferase
MILKLFKLGSVILPYIPYRISYSICAAVGWLLFWVLPSKRHAIMLNLSHVLPEHTIQQRHKVGQGIIKNNLCNYVDIMRVGKITNAQIEEQVLVRGIEGVVLAAQKRGKGLLAISGHLGSFSFVSRMASRKNVYFNLVVEPIKPPEMYDFIKMQRQTDSMSRVIAVGGMEVREIFHCLKRNELVCMAIDRDVSGDGVMLDFFGSPAPIPLGVAEIALRTRAEIVFVHPYRLPNGKHVVDFIPGFTPESTGNKEADVRAITERMLRGVERIIRSTPENWVVLQQIWEKPRGEYSGVRSQESESRSKN